MKSFLRENPTIAFGLGLPLLLVTVFLLVSGVPTLFVAPPQYDVLYTTGNQYYKRDVKVSVVNQKAQLSHRSDIDNNTYRNNELRLWRYNPQTGAVKEIAIVLPTSTESRPGNQTESEYQPKTTTVDIAELAGLTIDSSSIAPDGYEFKVDSRRYSGNVFGGLFYSRRYNSDALLTKSGRNVRLPNTVNNYYGRTAELLGWVVAE